MKITKYLRFLLIALAAVMAFSLFACTEPEEEESSSVEEPSESDSTPVDDPSDSDESSDESSEETTTPKEDCQHVEEVLEAVAATCETTGLTAGKKCSVCGEILEAQTEVPALGHAWGDGVVTTEPTCTAAGVKTFTCSNDATHTKTEEVPALGHTVATYTTYVANPDGDEAMIAGECSVCGEMGTKPASFFTSVESIFGDAGEAGVTIFQASETIAPYMSPAKFVYAAGHPSYPANGYSPIPTDSPAYPGMLGIAGWAAYLDSAVTDGAVYKIVDAEGNVIVDWQPIADQLGLGVHSAGGEAIDAFIAANITEYTGVGIRFYHIIDLKPLWGILNGKTVTVELAFTTAKGVEGDVYVPYASLSVVVPACEHVAGEPDIADNCNVKCTKCGAVLEAAKHVFGDEVPAVDATCDVAGNVAYKNCSACGKNYDAEGNVIEDVVIPALGHKTVDKTFTAPTTAEEGWLAHKYCEACGTAWSTEGEKLDAVPTIPVIVPTTNKFWGVTDMATWVVAGGNITLEDGSKVPSKFKTAVISDDRTYVRFERDGASTDGNINFMTGNTDVTGKYLVIKYRTDHATSGEFWANTTENSHSSGKANFNASFVADSNWHLMIVDLSTSISNYVKAAEDGTYTIQWARIDLLNATADAGYFDIAYIAFTDDLSKVASIMQDGDESLCPHYAAPTPDYVNENADQHSTACVVCGAKSYGNHAATNGTTWDSEKKCYTGTCVCGANVVSDMIYKTESYSVGSADSAGNFLTVTKHDGFIRYTAGETDKTDLYFYPYRYGTAVTGQYMVIKYRASNNGVNLATGQKFASSAASGANAGATGSNQNWVTPDTWIADGNWHTMIIYPKAENVSFTPNADGTYSWGYLRLNINGITPGGYVDIAEIAFADNQEAAEYYAHNNDATPPFLYNFDNTNNTIDDATFFGKNMQAYGCLTVDMSTYAALTTPTSLNLGGWVCTPGGVSAYYIRVTKIDGEAVEAPELVKWQDGANRADLYTPIIVPRGLSEAAQNGAGFAKKVVDLSAYAGKTIDFELVAVTNYGATVVFGNFTNLAVPVVPNYLVNANALSNQTEHAGLTYALSADGEYVTYTHKAGEEWSDCFAYAIYPPASVNVPTVTTGEYIMIKYRTTSTLDWGMFIGANNGDDHAIGGKDSFTVAIKNGDKGAIIADGEWQYLIIDAKFLTAWNGVLPEDGTEDVYSIDYLRIDYFNKATDGGETVDVAYVAISDSIDELVVYAGMDSYTYVDSYSGGVINKTVVVNEAQ